MKFKNTTQKTIAVSKVKGSRSSWTHIRPGQEIEWDDPEQMRLAGLSLIAEEKKSKKEASPKASSQMLNIENESEAKLLLDQNEITVLRQIKKSEFTKTSYNILLEAEKNDKNRKKITAYLGKVIK